jgi:hypothetical protein
MIIISSSKNKRKLKNSSAKKTFGYLHMEFAEALNISIRIISSIEISNASTYF